LSLRCYFFAFFSLLRLAFVKKTKGSYHSSDTFLKLMSKDLCRNEDLYLHEKLDGMFVFISLRHQRREAKKKEEGNDNKIHILTILEMLCGANKQTSKHRYQHEGPTGLSLN
jgi:hypothetical protein